MAKPAKTILITGGAGFIGSCAARQWLRHTDWRIVCVDALTYAGNLRSLAEALDSERFAFERADIRERRALDRILSAHRPDAISHLAAESHVDRSIDGPADFIQTNVTGTFNLLEAAREYWNELESPARGRFRFHHISTDEVFGCCEAGGFFTEDSPYAPNSPYSASKAASDHLARAWHRTYGLPVVTTNCSNNYGPYQYPEKLIPLTVLNAIAGKPLPVYGDGAHVRDWLYVGDHVEALKCVLERGIPGQTYNVGARVQHRNLDLVKQICSVLDELRPDGAPHARLIAFVPDRPGHDRRYAIDPARIERELGWKPAESFASGLRKTVQWYLDNGDWVRAVATGCDRHQAFGGIPPQR